MANKSLVITTNISSITEVGGKAAFYINNVKDCKALADKINEVLTIDKKEKEKRISIGLEQVNKFTWEKCAKEILKLLNN